MLKFQAINRLAIFKVKGKFSNLISNCSMSESYSPQEYVKSANSHMAKVTTENENLFIITKVCTLLFQV